MKFETFINEISPKNTFQVSISGNKIRETIKCKSSIISSSFLTGSYSRSTKIDPIDDLDIFFNINFSNTQIENSNNGIKIFLTGDYNNHQLKNFCTYENYKYYVSPIQLINHIGKIIGETYATTNKHSRNGECYTVNLSSYSLTIDCVPYTGVRNEDYLLIPAGGNNLIWKKTNPKVDKEKIDELNSENNYNGKLKGIIKIIKYWNKNKNTSKIKSYTLECLIYYAIQEKCNKDMLYIDLLKNVLDYIYDNIKSYCNIIDLPQYDCIQYYVNKERINFKLLEFYKNLNISEEHTINYLKSN
ncbi:MAG: hypothetical protein PHF46_00190 [Candidatus Gracilibacteria bacterium]|nr:hypothetical protein [Candidatus Gracilibacteria bacterium]MDD4531062.1 hypothetical protein [Candidatus Gracilibacteria bacterium]